MSAIIEAAARALCRIEQYPEARWHMQTSGAEIILAAVTPLIRAAALEKAANAATAYFLFRSEDTEDVYQVCEAIAARIRAFKEQP